MAPDDPTTRFRFTPQALKALRARATAYVVSDPGMAGLKLRVLPSGRKVWRWDYWRTVDGKASQTTLTLGPWSFEAEAGHLTLSQARERLEALKRAHAAGRLQEEHEALSRTPAAGPTVKILAEEWYRRAIQGVRRRPAEVRRTLDRDILPGIGHLAIASVTAADCRRVVLGVIDRGAVSHAGKVLDHLKQLFWWAQGFGIELTSNPAAVLSKDALGVRTRKGKRVLSAEEIPIFWDGIANAAPGVRRVSRQVVLSLRLLLLTGVRTGELLQARWTEVDWTASTWTIPVEHQKLNPKQIPDAKPWVVPLPSQAIVILRELEALSKKEKRPSPWVIASDSKLGHLTDKALSHALRGLFERKLLHLEGGRATPHDLRRTMRTKLGELGVPPHIAERCLNHALGRIASTYDHGDYLKERRSALDLWGAYVERLVSPSDSTVTFLRAR